MGQPREMSEPALDHEVACSGRPSGSMLPAEDSLSKAWGCGESVSELAGRAWVLRPEQQAGDRPPGVWCHQRPGRLPDGGAF